MRKPFFILVCLLSVLDFKGALAEKAKTDTDVYIVYLGEKEHDDEERITNSHLDMLAQVVGSKEEASKAMVYSYKHGFSGFAAKLTKSQAKELEDFPDVIQVTRSGSYKLHTTRSFDYLDIAINSPNNLLQKTNMGDDIIIGVIDSGIWPESPAFSDEGLGPIPSKWKGKCVDGDEFFAEKHCNRKIIGAYYFIDGLLAKKGIQLQKEDYVSPRDGSVEGHGTHVASVAAGTCVDNVSYKGVGAGTARGAAPRARLAIYKVCWETLPNIKICSEMDVLSAFVQAAKDGVDVILAAFGNDEFPSVTGSMVSIYNGMGIGSLQAIAKGIPVITSAGNCGPEAFTVANTEAWLLTVGSTSIDRSFPTPIVLGDDTTYLGQAVHDIKSSGFNDLLFLASCKKIGDPTIPPDNIVNITGRTGLCFCDSFCDTPFFKVNIMNYLKGQGAVGLIYARDPTDKLHVPQTGYPYTIEVGFEVAAKIYKYMTTSKFAAVKVNPSRTLVGKTVPIKVAAFSSRGPISSSDISPAILKPDLVAPGVTIISAVPSVAYPPADNGYSILSGTSVSAAHVAGIMAMLKAIHPDWSPAALKSALMTTARSDENGFQLRAEGAPLKPANPFDMGSGLVNPNQALDPGLVYDMLESDYLDYLCAMGFRRAAIDRFLVSGEKKTCHPKKRPNILNVNLPSIIVPVLANSTTLTRAVTNVGPVESMYKAKLTNPTGTIISVNPNVLVFNARTKKLSFEVTISVTKPATMDYTFGNLVWTDGSHEVKTPIVVQVQSFS
ncbi:hypothetical protein LguiA_015857 [Lonicera macranthoides]